MTGVQTCALPICFPVTIGGENGINAITAVDVQSGKLSLDTLNLAQKVYNMLNRVAVSGGSYEDWIEAVYATNYIARTETPIYMGGLSKEIVFQEVVSTAASSDEPLGTLARYRDWEDKKADISVSK